MSPPLAGKRVAAIDIGTNTVLLLVAEAGAGGAVIPVAQRSRVTRLGEGVDRSGTLLPEAIQRTGDCLEKFAEELRVLGVHRLRIVGTSAMRDAQGGERLQERVRSLFGTDAQVIRGEEEARLSFRGAIGGLGVETATDVAVFDLGGGSTEVVIGRIQRGMQQVTFAASYDVGSVRMTERFISHDPPSKAERNALAGAAAAAFASVPRLPNALAPIGVAGTMTTLAAVSLRIPYDADRVHGHVMAVPTLRRVTDELGSMDLGERKRVPGMHVGRADVIVSGGIIALALLDIWGAEAVRISDRGVRWGVVEELLAEGSEPGPEPTA